MPVPGIGGRFASGDKQPEIDRKLQVGLPGMTELSRGHVEKMIHALLEHHVCVDAIPGVVTVGVETVRSVRVLVVSCRRCSKTHHILNAD